MAWRDKAVRAVCDNLIESSRIGCWMTIALAVAGFVVVVSGAPDVARGGDPGVLLFGTAELFVFLALSSALADAVEAERRRREGRFAEGDSEGALSAALVAALALTLATAVFALALARPSILGPYPAEGVLFAQTIAAGAWFSSATFAAYSAASAVEARGCMGRARGASGGSGPARFARPRRGRGSSAPMEGGAAVEIRLRGKPEEVQDVAEMLERWGALDLLSVSAQHADRGKPGRVRVYIGAAKAEQGRNALPEPEKSK